MDSGAGGSAFGGLRISAKCCARGLRIGKAPGLESDDAGSLPFFLRFTKRRARSLEIGAAPGLESDDAGSLPFSLRLFMRNKRRVINICN